MTAYSLFEKIWQEHCVEQLPDDRGIIAIDRLLLHEITGGYALRNLANKRSSLNFNMANVMAVSDHSISTNPNRGLYDSPISGGSNLILSLEKTCKEFGIKYLEPDSAEHGIVHLVAAEQAFIQPGLSLVCGDSHTCTLGAVGSLSWGIGATEIKFVLEAGALILKKPKKMRIMLHGNLPSYTYSKDIMLYLLGKYGADFARGYAIEYAGSLVDSFSLDARFTLCNMSAELGTRYALIAPNEEVFEYITSRKAFNPEKKHAALETWKTLYTDPNTLFDKEITCSVTELEPYVTWGVSPMHATAITQKIPDPEKIYHHQSQIEAAHKALNYMQLKPKDEIKNIPIDVAFIGSCTNSRLSDLQIAAKILQGKKLAPGVIGMCTPGSMQVKIEAEKLGLDQIFKEAGFLWRMPGCSNCGGREGPIWAGKRVISSTNRNFENRQGSKTKTHLASPATVAASAITGFITDPRIFI